MRCAVYRSVERERRLRRERAWERFWISVIGVVGYTGIAGFVVLLAWIFFPSLPGAWIVHY
jgi:hypothetical protein